MQQLKDAVLAITNNPKSYPQTGVRVYPQVTLFEAQLGGHKHHFAFSPTGEMPDQNTLVLGAQRTAAYHYAFGNWYICELSS